MNTCNVEFTLRPAGMNKYQRIAFESLAITIFGINKISGNAPFTFDRRTMRFETTRSHLVYPALITSLYIGLHIQFNTATVCDSSLMHIVLIGSRYAGAASSFVMNCLNRRHMVRHLNASRDTLAFIGGQCEATRPFRFVGPTAEVAVYLLVSAVLTIYGSVGMFEMVATSDLNGPTTTHRAVVFGLRLFNYLLLSATLNNFFVAMWLVRFYFHRIAEHVDDVVSEAGRLQAAKDRHGVRAFARLRQRLDRLSDMHAQLVWTCRRYNALVSVQLLVGLGFKFIVLLTQVCGISSTAVDMIWVAFV